MALYGSGLHPFASGSLSSQLGHSLAAVAIKSDPLQGTTSVDSIASMDATVKSCSAKPHVVNLQGWHWGAKECAGLAQDSTIFPGSGQSEGDLLVEKRGESFGDGNFDGPHQDGDDFSLASICGPFLHRPSGGQPGGQPFVDYSAAKAMHALDEGSVSGRRLQNAGVMPLLMKARLEEDQKAAGLQKMVMENANQGTAGDAPKKNLVEGSNAGLGSASALDCIENEADCFLQQGWEGGFYSEEAAASDCVAAAMLGPFEASCSHHLQDLSVDEDADSILEAYSRLEEEISLNQISGDDAPVDDPATLCRSLPENKFCLAKGSFLCSQTQMQDAMIQNALSADVARSMPDWTLRRSWLRSWNQNVQVPCGGEHVANVAVDEKKGSMSPVSSKPVDGMVTSSETAPTESDAAAAAEQGSSKRRRSWNASVENNSPISTSRRPEVVNAPKNSADQGAFVTSSNEGMRPRGGQFGNNQTRCAWNGCLNPSVGIINNWQLCSAHVAFARGALAQFGTLLEGLGDASVMGSNLLSMLMNGNPTQPTLVRQGSSPSVCKVESETLVAREADSLLLGPMDQAKQQAENARSLTSSASPMSQIASEGVLPEIAAATPMLSPTSCLQQCQSYPMVASSSMSDLRASSSSLAAMEMQTHGVNHYAAAARRIHSDSLLSPGSMQQVSPPLVSPSMSNSQGFHPGGVIAAGNPPFPPVPNTFNPNLGMLGLKPQGMGPYFGYTPDGRLMPMVDRSGVPAPVEVKKGKRGRKKRVPSTTGPCGATTNLRPLVPRSPFQAAGGPVPVESGQAAAAFKLGSQMNAAAMNRKVHGQNLALKMLQKKP